MARGGTEPGGPDRGDPWIAAIGRALAGLEPRARPKHARLSEALRRVLRDGTGLPGERLPPERTLARALGLSVGTVQKALATLTLEGALSRELGRGTFARLRWGHFAGPWHFRFVQHLGDEPEGVVCTRLAIATVRSRGPWSRALGDDPSGFVRLARRLELPSGQPLLSTSWVRADRFGALARLPVAAIQNENLRVTLRERFGVPTLSARQAVGADRLPAAACRALGLAPGTVGMVMEIVGCGLDQAPIFYADILCPPGPYRMLQPLASVAWGAVEPVALPPGGRSPPGKG